MNDFEKISNTNSTPEGQIAETIRVRLNELAALEPGWYAKACIDPGNTEEGKVITTSEIERVSELLKICDGKNIPIPALYPRPEGGCVAEWTINGFEIAADFDFSENEISISAINFKTHENEDVDINLDNTDATNSLSQFLLQFTGETN